MPGLHRLTDLNSGHDACGPIPLVTASDNTFCNNLMVGRLYDIHSGHGCDSHPYHSDTLIEASPNVFCNGRGIARQFDNTDYGSYAVGCSPNVFVNESGSTNTSKPLVISTFVPTPENKFLAHAEGEARADIHYDSASAPTSNVPETRTTAPVNNSQKAQEITNGKGIDRVNDTKEFCDSLIVPLNVKCRNPQGVIYTKKLMVNKNLVDSIVAIFDDILTNSDFCVRNNDTACYCYRKVAGTSKLSYHSYGMAIDINWSSNPYNKNAGGSNTNIQIRDTNSPVVQAFQRNGWGWGGRYGDLMHFSYFNGC